MSKREIIRIYTNESVNVAIAEGLRRRGVNAISAKDAGNLGLTDEDQLKYALKEKLVIFTHDDDFLSLVRKSKLEHGGIIYVHQQRLSIGEYIRRIKFLVETRSPNEMMNRIEFL